MIEFNDRRVVHSFLGMLVIGTNAFMSDATDENKQACLLSLRMLNYIAEDCSKQLIEQNAEEILTTIGNVIPEANDVLANIKASGRNATGIPATAENQPRTWANWFCPVL